MGDTDRFIMLVRMAIENEKKRNHGGMDRLLKIDKWHDESGEGRLIRKTGERL